MKKRLFIALVLLMAATSVAFAATNQLENSDFESGSSPWIEVNNTEKNASISATSETGSNRAARLYFNKQYDEGIKDLLYYQEFDVTDINKLYTAKADVLAHSQSAQAGSVGDGYTAFVALSWFDADGVQIGPRYDSAYLTSPNDMWQLFSVSAISPESAVKGRVSLMFTAGPEKSGLNRAVFFDNVSVMVPEPVSSVLFFMGGAAIAVRRKFASKKS